MEILETRELCEMRVCKTCETGIKFKGFAKPFHNDDFTLYECPVCGTVRRVDKRTIYEPIRRKTLIKRVVLGFLTVVCVPLIIHLIVIPTLRPPTPPPTPVIVQEIVIPEFPPIVIEMPPPIQIPPQNETPQNEDDQPTQQTLRITSPDSVWEYVGDALNELPHGEGRKEFSNGNWLDGTWSEGEFISGEGFYVRAINEWIRGEIQDGHWVRGEAKTPCGTHYEGGLTFRDGRIYRHGTGRATWPNGDYYYGEWSFNERHGAGVSFHAESGTRREGVWVRNELMAR